MSDLDIDKELDDLERTLSGIGAWFVFNIQDFSDEQKTRAKSILSNIIDTIKEDDGGDSDD